MPRNRSYGPAITYEMALGKKWVRYIPDIHGKPRGEAESRARLLRKGDRLVPALIRHIRRGGNFGYSLFALRNNINKFSAEAALDRMGVTGAVPRRKILDRCLGLAESMREMEELQKRRPDISEEMYLKEYKDLAYKINPDLSNIGNIILGAEEESVWSRNGEDKHAKGIKFFTIWSKYRDELMDAVRSQFVIVN